VSYAAQQQLVVQNTTLELLNEVQQSFGDPLRPLAHLLGLIMTLQSMQKRQNLQNNAHHG
jgi:hypothetical protein